MSILAHDISSLITQSPPYMRPAMKVVYRKKEIMTAEDLAMIEKLDARVRESEGQRISHEDLKRRLGL